MIRFAAFLVAILAAVSAQADERFITLSSTTSTQDSGLFGHILPIFTAATGITVHVVAVGTGQALAIGARGDADALLVHDRVGEDKFVADGFGIDRRDVMYNDFVIVGPGSDPALFNPYGSILVNPAKWRKVKYNDAKIWHEWLTSKVGLDAITSYRINGEELFFPPRKATTN